MQTSPRPRQRAPGTLPNRPQTAPAHTRLCLCVYRCRFEHVFLGESDNGQISGFHNCE